MEQWIFTGGSASSSEISEFLMASASSSVRPRTHSVTKELDAMAEPQLLASVQMRVNMAEFFRADAPKQRALSGPLRVRWMLIQLMAALPRHRRSL